MAQGYTEERLVNRPAREFLRDELGWDVVYAYDQETLGPYGTLGRPDYETVILPKYFNQAMHRLNANLTDVQLSEATSKLKSHLASASLLDINEEKYALIRDGIDVKDPAKGPAGKRRLRLIDFDNAENNSFLAVAELKVHNDYHKKRADLVGFVNGIPLAFFEFKDTHISVKNGYTENYSDYVTTIPQLFYYNAFVIFSNGLDARIGTLGSKYEFFGQWKHLQEGDTGSKNLKNLLRGVCNKKNFLDLLENFILYDHGDGKTAKILAHNHQFLGVNQAVVAYAQRQERQGKLGVFWHTQGSGKSYSMIFFAKKIRRKFAGSPTFVILNDRDELNTQLSGTFESCGMLEGKEAKYYIATSGADLLRKLRGNPSFIFTLIQKFNNHHPQPIYPDHDIILVSDEAHRTQYGIFADNMCRLLPTACRIGFTGTPLMQDDNITERTFGGYISVYDFQDAVEDGATVPLYYENRGEKILHLKNPSLSDDIITAIDEMEDDVAERERLYQRFSNPIHVLMARPRLESIARDFVHHYSELWTSGKAMFVCLNRVACVMMYDLVQTYWQEEIARQEKELKSIKDQQEAQVRKRKIAWMKETEMAVVVSSEQNEEKDFQKWGLDIGPHRAKMARRKLDKEFKDKDNPFRIVFVCAMWLTGFDVKCLSCLYLDKPMKAHTLMQAIARANRVSEGKANGLIIDYVGILGALRKALAEYTSAGSHGPVNPVIDKDELLKHIVDTVQLARAFLATNHFDLQALVEATGFDKMDLLKEGANAVCGSDADKKKFSTYATELHKYMKYVGHEELDPDVLYSYHAIWAIYHMLHQPPAERNDTEIAFAVHRILNENVVMMPKGQNGERAKIYDISKIDFSRLQVEFEKQKRKQLLIKDLSEVIENKLQAMMAVNSNAVRINFYEKYQDIIESYNNEKDSVTIEEIFQQLLELTKQISEEDRRAIREGFTNEKELAIYDLLCNPVPKKEDIKAIKKISVDVFEKVSEAIQQADHWKDKQETKAAIETLIHTTLFNELPEAYTEKQIVEFKGVLFEYFYNRF